MSCDRSRGDAHRGSQCALECPARERGHATHQQTTKHPAQAAKTHIDVLHDHPRLFGLSYNNHDRAPARAAGIKGQGRRLPAAVSLLSATRLAAATSLSGSFFFNERKIPARGFAELVQRGFIGKQKDLVTIEDAMFTFPLGQFPLFRVPHAVEA